MPAPGTGKFTPEIADQIVKHISEGAFISDAARAVGISPRCLQKWLASDKPKFRAFQKAVSAAKGQSVSCASKAVFKLNPLAWLKMGPGARRDPTEPGWKEPTEKATTHVNVLLMPQVSSFLRQVAEELADHPEALAKLQNVIQKNQQLVIEHKAQ